MTHILVTVAAAIMSVVGLGLFLSGRGKSQAGPSARQRVGRLLLVAGVGLAVVALVMTWRAAPHLRPVKELQAADVTEIRLGEYAISDLRARAEIVEALEAQIKKLRQDEKADLMKVLTDAQRARLKEILKEKSGVGESGSESKSSGSTSGKP
mgnify:CR=1 FL=1